MLDAGRVKKSESKSSGSAATSLVERKSDETTIVWVGDVPIGGNEAVVMAGPCSVESCEQVTATLPSTRSLAVGLAKTARAPLGPVASSS